MCLMNKILLILSILITFSFTAEAQDLNNKMNSVLKEKAIKKIDEKKKSEVKTEEPKTDNNQTLVNPTSNDNMKNCEYASNCERFCSSAFGNRFVDGRSQSYYSACYSGRYLGD